MTRPNRGNKQQFVALWGDGRGGAHPSTATWRRCWPKLGKKTDPKKRWPTRSGDICSHGKKLPKTDHHSAKQQKPSQVAIKGGRAGSWGAFGTRYKKQKSAGRGIWDLFSGFFLLAGFPSRGGGKSLVSFFHEGPEFLGRREKTDFCPGDFTREMERDGKVKNSLGFFNRRDLLKKARPVCSAEDRKRGGPGRARAGTWQWVGADEQLSHLGSMSKNKNQGTYFIKRVFVWGDPPSLAAESAGAFIANWVFLPRKTYLGQPSRPGRFPMAKNGGICWFERGGGEFTSLVFLRLGAKTSRQTKNPGPDIGDGDFSSDRARVDQKLSPIRCPAASGVWGSGSFHCAPVEIKGRAVAFINGQPARPNAFQGQGVFHRRREGGDRGGPAFARQNVVNKSD